jgi:hypothetical protein
MTMATKRAGKSSASSKVKATTQKQAGKGPAPAAAQLQKLIERLIDAKQRGDHAAANTAKAALAAFSKSVDTPRLRQAAAEAQAVAGHAVMVESLRMLENVRARGRANT